MWKIDGVIQGNKICCRLQKTWEVKCLTRTTPIFEQPELQEVKSNYMYAQLEWKHTSTPASSPVLGKIKEELQGFQNQTIDLHKAYNH